MGERRRTVLQLLAEGKRRDQIAAEMCVTVETVKSHLKEIRWALRARNTTHAVAIAIREGLIR